MATAFELEAKEAKEYIGHQYEPGARIENQPWMTFEGGPNLSKDGGKTRSIVNGLGTVQGIQDEYFSKLNGTDVYLWARKDLVRRQRDKYEKLIEDNGKPQWEVAPKPNAEVVGVLSSVNLKLPYKYQPTEEGLGFADIYPTGEYMYYLPKSMVYRKNVTCLAISSRKNLKAYNGWSLQTYRYGRVYIGVIPWKLRMNFTNTIILGCKVGDDWSVEFHSLLEWMQASYLMPVLNIFPSEVIDELRLIESIEGAIGYSEVEDSSLGEQDEMKNTLKGDSNIDFNSLYL